MIRIVNQQPEADPPPLQLVERVSGIFSRGGLLQEVLGLEYRPEQEQMALHVAQSLLSDEPLLFEAGTGVGKSLAYLIPGLLFSVDTDRPMVVSSHTIALQEQVLNKDLPLCTRFFQAVPELAAYAGFKTALLVGKANYLCENRLARFLQREQPELLPGDEKEEWERLRAWAADTPTGQRQELNPQPPPEIWDQINADSSTCNRKNCGDKGCSYRRARARLLASHVRIVNHSLLFSLLNAGMGPGGKSPGILFPADFLVLDEAHTVPAIATQHFGIGVSSYAVRFALTRLYNPKKKSGFLTRHRDSAALKLVEVAARAAEEFFGALYQQYLSRREILRLREPDWAEPTLQAPLKRLIDRLATLEYHCEDDTHEEELKDHRQRLTALRDGLQTALSLADETQVYWLERNRSRSPVIHVRSAPLDIAPILRQALFQRRTSAILTSATLSLGDHMDHFREKVGGHGLPAAIEDSPFDFPNQMEILLAKAAPDRPEPGDQYQTDIPLLCRYLLALLRRQGGGALVLFTSYRDLSAAGRRLRETLDPDKRPLFIQGEGPSRSRLIKDFREAGNGILLGTDSFWTGVDIPGPALTLLFLARLPFENPTHPVAEAKSEWFRSRGENPFAKLTLPEALIKFRQGIGRLIRNQRDTGRLLILDPRIHQREYGRHFLNVLPHQRHRRITPEEAESLPQLP